MLNRLRVNKPARVGAFNKYASGPPTLPQIGAMNREFEDLLIRVIFSRLVQEWCVEDKLGGLRSCEDEVDEIYGNDMMEKVGGTSLKADPEASPRKLELSEPHAFVVVHEREQVELVLDVIGRTTAPNFGEKELVDVIHPTDRV